MKNRTLLNTLCKKALSKFGRITVISGARQTGKTTLVKQAFPDYAYLSMDDPISRTEYAELSATQWYEQYPLVILDEVQKLPQLIESVKSAYDAHEDARFILLGSSQILLMDQIRESLAGRASLLELYPLTLPEMLSTSWDEPLQDSRLIQFLNAPDNPAILNGIPVNSHGYAKAWKMFKHYLNFGAMPAIVAPEIDDRDKRDWLADYVSTYLQRDVRDLANMRDLEPFVRAQRTLAALTSQTINLSNLAKQAGISNPTAKRFINYLEMSYQVISLQPWFRNQSKRLSKSPKVHFLDSGIQRVLLKRTGELTGAEFKSAVVAECFKQIKNSRLPISCYHLRTVDGREVDLLLELEDGFIAIEVKQTKNVSATDARHLKNLEELLDKPLLHALVISNDTRIKEINEKITAVPAAWLFSAET